MDEMLVRKIDPKDIDWVKKVIVDSWGSETVIASKPFDATKLPGFIAETKGKPVGLITYNIDGDNLEIISIDSLEERKGVGTVLMDKAKETARENNLKTVNLITSNDNIDALKFYQKRGFRIIKIYPDAIDEARKIKPQIPLLGNYGIPLKDALELECKCKQGDTL